VQILEALRPLAQRIAVAGLLLAAFPEQRWREVDARALGSAFSGHALKRLDLHGLKRSLDISKGFLPALATALPALESLSLFCGSILNGESLQDSSIGGTAWLCSFLSLLRPEA
jgi:hypothetical protein